MSGASQYDKAGSDTDSEADGMAGTSHSQPPTATAPNREGSGQHTTSSATRPESAPHWLDVLLADPLTAELVGKNFDRLAVKWRNCFGYLESPESLHWFTSPFSRRGLLGNFSWDNVKSFIWPAVLGPYWFLYRKVYVLAGALFALSLGLALLPHQPLFLTLIIILFSLNCAPALYLCHVRNAVADLRTLSNSEDRARYIARHGNTSWIAVAVGVTVVFGISIILSAYIDNQDPAPQADLSPSRGQFAACDSASVLQTTKELVIRRIHNSGFDDSFDLAINNIRVQESSSNQLLCKANAVLTNSAMLAAVGAKTFTYDVDYQVEQTTEGKLFITVYPLHMLQN